MLKWSAHAVSIAIAITGSGCGQPPSGDNTTETEPTVTSWDSAGVEIVENHAPEWSADEFWTIDPEPEFVLGGLDDLGALANDSSQLIWRVAGLARLVDGRVAVLSWGTKQLFLFEPSGMLSRTIGRAGEGPGEFSRPEHLQYLPPDTLVVWDYHMQSIIHFDTAGTVLRQRRADHSGLREHGVTGESFRFPLPDGSFVASLSSEEEDTEPTWSDCSPKESWRTSLSINLEPVTTRKATRPAREFLLIDTSYAAHSFGCPGIIAAGGDPLSVYVSTGERNEIHQFAPNGDLVRVIRRTTEPLAVTARARRAREERTRQGFEERGQMPPDGMIEEMRRIKTYPPIVNLMVDSEGYLWVVEYSESETWLADQWSIFSPEGRWLGVLSMPVDGVATAFFRCVGYGTVCWIDRDFHVVVAYDELGVERVEGYRIRRNTPGEGPLP